MSTSFLKIFFLSAVTSLAVAKTGKPEIIPIFELGKVEVSGRKNYEKDVKYYREPNAIVTKSGALVVVAGQHDKIAKNDRAHQDGLCRISRDNGKTWTKTDVLADIEKNSVLPTCLVYDAEVDRIIFIYNIIYNSPELKEKRGCQQFVRFSDDDGKSWSEPKEISDQMKRKGAIHVFGGSNGIQLTKGKYKGRLLVPGGYGGPVMFYSDDHGETWKISQSAGKGRKEATACELPNGDVAMFARQSGYGVKMAVSKDGGVSWGKQNAILPDVWSSNNNGSLTYRTKSGKKILLYSGPLGPENDRFRLRPASLTAKSLDQGRVSSIGAGSESD